MARAAPAVRAPSNQRRDRHTFHLSANERDRTTNCRLRAGGTRTLRALSGCRVRAGAQRRPLRRLRGARGGPEVLSRAERGGGAVGPGGAEQARSSVGPRNSGRKTRGVSAGVPPRSRGPPRPHSSPRHRGRRRLGVACAPKWGAFPRPEARGPPLPRPLGGGLLRGKLLSGGCWQTSLPFCKLHMRKDSSRLKWTVSHTADFVTAVRSAKVVCAPVPAHRGSLALPTFPLCNRNCPPPPGLHNKLSPLN